jgi:hypothetical protein
MANKAKIKRCGHGGCSLTTPECCGCEDRRIISKSYARYIDGVGYVEDKGTNARYKDYCTPCRRQLENLFPGRKRCGCGVVTCNLTANQCCVCLDKRPESQAYYKYEDGKGMVETSATRWMHYCPPCRKRCRRQQRMIQNEITSNAQCDNSTTSSESFTISPAASVDQSSPLKSEQNFPCAGSIPQSCSVAKISSAPTTADHVELQSGETCVTEDTPAEASATFADVQDYEIVNLDDLHCYEDVVINGIQVEKHANRSRSGGHWWVFTLKH